MKALSALLLALLLAACAGVPKPPPGLGENQAIVAPKTVLTIPPPSAAGRSVDLAQSIVAKFHGRSYALDMQIAIAPDRLDLVAMDGFGRRAMTVTWKDGVPSIQKAEWLPPVFRPADILASFVIAYWPDDVVKAAIADPSVQVSTKDGVRRISRGGKNLITVTYGPGEGWNRSAVLTNEAFGYEIAIQSAEN
jgi:hypothetical protein